MQRKSVLLPEPEEPMMEMTSPALTEKEISLSTSFCPEVLLKVFDLQDAIVSLHFRPPPPEW